MTDWRLVIEAIQNAAALGPQDAQDLLGRTLQDQNTLDLARRLLPRVVAKDHFMRTLETNDGVESDSTELKPNDRIGVWRIEALIGRGGMGEVYRARRDDGRFEQTVALKLIQGLEQSRVRRFSEERKRLARLEHPNVARIVDGGETPDGRAFMAMEYVDGMPIDAFVRDNALSRNRTLELFVQLCQAVGHAHGRFILHRDLKPQNVLVDAQGQVRLIDFGIASDLDDETAGGAALTLSSAAPEQLKREPISVQTDIFALGVLLHVLLAKTLPERRADAGMQIVEAAVKNADLIAIVRRCLEIDPTRRYPSVDALKADVAAANAGMPVAARGGGRTYRLGKFVKRFPFATGLAAALVIALALGLAVSLKLARDSQREFERANAALAKAEENLKRSEFSLRQADLFKATQSAYADALHYMFSGNANVERQTEVLRNRWRQVYEKRKEDPDNAAYLSFAIGRQFLFRDDFVTAIEVLSPLVHEKFGPADLSNYARQLLAIAFMASGRKQEALAYLRESEAWLASGYLAGTGDHIAAASQIASITAARSDIETAEKLLLAGLAQNPAPSTRLFFWSQLAKLRQRKGDFPAAYDAAKQSVFVVSSTALIEVAGSDTAILALAEYELWYTKNLSRAQELVATAIRMSETQKGASREQGRARTINALILAERGELDLALREMERGIPLIERFTGPVSDATLVAMAQRAELQAAKGSNEAVATLGLIRSRLANRPPDGVVLNRFMLAEAYVTARLDGQAAGHHLYSGLKFDRGLIRSNLQLFSAHKRLETMGAAP
jgi:eukaryotic-like serine/threonine-protein kinase